MYLLKVWGANSNPAAILAPRTRANSQRTVSRARVFILFATGPTHVHYWVYVVSNNSHLESAVPWSSDALRKTCCRIREKLPKSYMQSLAVAHSTIVVNSPYNIFTGICVYRRPSLIGAPFCKKYCPQRGVLWGEGAWNTFLVLAAKSGVLSGEGLL